MRKSTTGKAKKTVAVALFGALMAIPTGCAGNGSSQSGADGHDAVTTITYLSWENEEKARPWIEEFESENPDVKIDFSFAPPVAEYVQTLQTRTAGNQQPDVFRISPETRERLISEGLVADLSNEPYVKNLAEANRRAYTQNEKLYGVSFGAWEAGVFYNPKLLAEVGYNEVPDSWEEFLVLCEKLESRQIKAYMEPVDDVPKTFQSFLGNRYSKQDPLRGESAIFEGDSSFSEEWPEAVEQWKQLFDRGVLSADAVSLTGDQIRDEFLSGRVAMYTSGPWDLGAIEESGMEFGMAPIPGSKGAEFGAGASDPAFAISSKIEGSKREAADKFLTWIASDKGLMLRSKQFGDMITASNYETEVPSAYKEIYEKGLRESKFYLSMEYWTKGSDALQVEATAQFQQLAQGKISVEEMCKNMDSKVESILAE